MQLNRTFAIDKPAADDDGLIELAISSEAPYERWFGIEILSHADKSVDLQRLGDGRHPLLLNHDTGQQIGVIKSARIDGDRVLRGRAQFSRSELGQEIKQDVEDGIRSLVSVGYFIDQIEEVKKSDDGSETVVRCLSGAEFEREMRQAHGECWNRAGLAAARGKGETPPTFVVTKWTPFEASIVPVPADVSVGVGRSAGVDTPPQAPTPPVASIPSIEVKENSMTENTKTPAELEIERRDAIAGLAEGYAKYLQPNDAADAIRNGKSADQFRDLIMQRMDTKHTSARQIDLGMSEKDVRRYSFGRALVAAVTGDWTKAGFERECSQAVATIMGRSPEGFYVPFEIFNRDFNVGTTSEAGWLVPTDLRADLYTDALRNAMVFSQMGVRFLPGLTANVDIPRKATAGAIGMVTEIGSATETNPTTTRAQLSPKRASAYVEVSRQALIQSAIPLESMLRDDLVMGAANYIENRALIGTGAANPTGLRYVTGIGTVVGGSNGAAPTWAHIVDLESAAANANAEPDRLAGYLVNTKTRGKLKQTQFATNLPFVWQNGATPLNGYRAGVTNNLPSNITKGTSTTVCSLGFFGSSWDMLVVGLFGAPDITVDPYSKADTGQVKITLNQYFDVACRQPEAFSHVADWLAD